MGSIERFQENIKKFWNLNFVTKLILVVAAFLLWPFIAGWLLIRLVLKKVKNKKERWVLITAILLPTLFFGSAWVSVFFFPPAMKPTIALSDLESDRTVIASEFVISGKVEPPGSTLRIDDRAVEVGDDGTFTYTVSLEEGVNEIRVLATNSGVSSEVVRRIARELTPEEKAAKEAEEKRLAEEAAKRKAEEEAAEKRRKAEEETTIKKSALRGISYANLVKNNEKYVGKVVYFRSRVSQTTDAGVDRYTLRVYITRGNYGIWDDDVWVDYTGGRLLEDEIIDLWGTVTGLKEYTTVLGASRTIPWITSLYVESVK